MRLATAEANEPAHGGIPAARSVWFRWMAPALGVAQLTGIPSYATVGVYRGSLLQSLESVPSSTQTNGVNFSALEAATYHIAIDDPHNSSGIGFNAHLRLDGLKLTAPSTRSCKLGEVVRIAAEPFTSNWNLSRLEFFAGTESIGSVTSAPWEIEWQPRTNGLINLHASGETADGGKLEMQPEPFRVRPTNDDFRDASELPPLVLSTINAFDLTGATLEPGETNYSGLYPSASLWWKWTPSLTTASTMDANGMRLTVYQGEDIRSLIPVAQSISSIHIPPWGGIGHTETAATFTNLAGQTYWFSVQSTEETQWSWRLSQRLHWLERTAAEHGDYALRPISFRVAQVGEVGGPATVTVRIKPSGAGTNWLFVRHLTNRPSFEWDWMPELPIDYEINAFGSYPSGEPWSSSVNVQVQPANDRKEFAAIIDGVTATVPFRTDRAEVEEFEPNLPTDVTSGTVWWRWRPETSTRVRLHASGTWGGLPVDVFTEANGTFGRVAHNEGRTLMPPLQGLTIFEAEAGIEYWVRVADTLPPQHLAQMNPPVWIPTTRTNFTLMLENAAAPLRSLAMLSTTLGTPESNGEIVWQCFARALTADGQPATNLHYWAQFYGGASLSDVRALGSPVTVWNPTPGVVPGAVGGWMANLPGVHAGDPFIVQLRAWNGTYGATYEAARANGGEFGRTPFLQVIAGSEVSGPTALTNLADVVIGARVSSFRSGELLMGAMTNGLQQFELRSSRAFLHSVETSADGKTWAPLMVLTNVTGTIKFFDTRLDEPRVSLFRTRVID